LVEARNGVLVVREGNITPQTRISINMENQNRKTVITSMTTAIIRINSSGKRSKSESGDATGTEQFASIRRIPARKDGGFRIPAENWAKK